MRLTHIELHHYRNARHLAIKLNTELCVFVGSNGSGKTTVLDAAALMLSWAVARIHAPESKGGQISETDILNDKNDTRVEIRCDAGQSHDSSLRWRQVRIRKGFNPSEVEKHPWKSNLGNLGEWAHGIRDRIGATNGLCSVPVMAYYPVDRVVVDIPLRIRSDHPLGLLETYDGALSGRANFRKFFEWYRNREDLENERRSEPERFAPDPQLEAVRRAIRAFLPSVTQISVRRSPLRMEITINGDTVRVEQLSGGEKCLLALVGDLARRLAIANPTLADPLEGAGVVLIDEIELHLHPEWQRMVIPRLRETFPRCQFLITTHSPQVITHVRPEDGLYVLTRGQWGIECKELDEYYGRTADRVLEDLMGLPSTRPDEVVGRLGELYRLIDGKELELAVDKIDALEKEIGQDSELSKARVLVKRMEVVGK